MMGIGAMTRKTWIVWALILLFPGFVGLSIHHAQKSSMQNRIDQAAQHVAESSAAQEYLQMYDRWSDLPADQKADSPWGYGSYGGSDIQTRLGEGQSDQLMADIPTLEKKGFVNYPDELADVMYGSGWQQEVERYKKESAIIEMVLVGSISLLAGGGLILGGCLSKLLTVYIIKKRSESDEVSDPQLEDVEDTPVSDEPQEESLVPDEASDVEEKEDDVPAQKDGGYFRSSQKSTWGDSSKSNDVKATELPMKPAEPMLNSQEKKQKDSYFGWAVEADGETELDTLMTTEPLTKELTELTEEVSAIRQFAANQQDQMRKLQDGYDWMIIRRFCLRIIRCIDNIDDRVVRLYERGEEAAVYLEDIRDELVFSLEASGIEQFGPDLKSPFKGLEKYAEAVRERIFTEETELVGCIAEVARPGYQYLVNDDDVKIVRCAQVKLYESKQT
jgi:molecular chaperone GrpE (heat shock protein)